MAELDSKTMSKIGNYISERNYYQALQTIKSYYSRIKNQTNLLIKLEFLFNYIEIFLGLDQIESGVELSKLIIDGIKKNDDIKNDDREEVCRILIKLSKLMKASCLAWQPVRNNIYQFFKHQLNIHYLPEIDQIYAFQYLSADQIYLARTHSKNIDNAQDLCAFLIEFSDKHIFRYEFELFILQFVLGSLSLSKNILANETFKLFIASHPYFETNRQFPYNHPILNFIYFLLLSIEENSTERFEILCNIYEPSWIQDPSNVKVIENIRKIYFPPHTTSTSSRPTTTNNNVSRETERPLNSSLSSLVTSIFNSFTGTRSSNRRSSSTAPNTQRENTQSNQQDSLFDVD